LLTLHRVQQKGLTVNAVTNSHIDGGMLNPY